MICLKVNYSLTSDCNLNCSGCNHYCPLVKIPEYADIEQFRENILKFKNICGSNSKYVELRLIGGEPFLHEDILEFFHISRSVMNDSKITCFTNGTLLDRHNNLDDILKKYNINLVISNYHLSYLENVYAKYPVKEKMMFEYEYLSTANDMSKSVCRFRNHKESCCSLDWNGNFHFCGTTEFIRYLVSEFGCEFAVTEGDDFINLDNVPSFSYLIKRKLEKRHFCGYCREPVMKSWKLYDGSNDWICT